MAILFDPVRNGVGRVIEPSDVLVMVSGFVVATVHFVNRRWDREQRESTYKSCRENLSPTVLLGLEFPVPGDVIATVRSSRPSKKRGIPGLIVLCLVSPAAFSPPATGQ